MIYNWYVPCSIASERTGNFYKVFSSSVWIVFFTTCILSAAIAVLIHRSAESDSVYYRNFSYSCYVIWAVATSVSVPEMPKCSKLRIFFFLWVCYCLVMSTVFQSFFTGFLIVPGIVKQALSIEDLISKNYTLYIDSEAFFFEGKEEGFPLRVILSSALTKFLEDEEGALLISEDVLKMQLSRFLNTFKICNFRNSYAFSVITFNPKNPYYGAFNAKILSIQEAGLTTKIIDEYYYNNPSVKLFNYNISKSKSDNKNDGAYFIFRIEHFKLLFYIFLCCNLSSVLMFLAELLWNKL